MKNDDAVPGTVEAAHQWNRAMVGVKALLGCTEGELECIGEKLLDQYIKEVNAVYAAMTMHDVTEIEQLRGHVAELQKALRLSADDHDDTAHIISQNAPKENVLRSIALKAKFARALLPAAPAAVVQAEPSELTDADIFRIADEIGLTYRTGKGIKLFAAAIARHLAAPKVSP